MTDDVKALVEGICAICGQPPHKHSGGYPNTCPMIATYTPKKRDELNDPWLKSYISAQADCIETQAAALTAQAEEIDSLKAANLVLISEHPGKNYPTSEVTKDEAIAMLQRRVTAQAEEIERLRARLEITDEITERYDGIACRDETIRLLEQKIAALKAAQEVKA